MKKQLLISILLLLGTTASFAQQKYWNAQTKLTPWRFPLPVDTSRISYEDLDGDKRPDIIRSFIADSIPIIWIDDDNDMQPGALEGDTDNDCLLLDLNGDGLFAGPEDLSIKWADTDDDGIADLQFVILNGKTDVRYRADYQSDYICVIDLEKDNIKSFIDWNKLLPQCWEHSGHSNFFQDYHGNTLLLKMHSSSFRVSDLRFNCENPFIFYDYDNDNLTEFALRLMDVPHVRPRPGEKKSPWFEGVNDEYDMRLSGNITWASMAWDMDNDNGQGNEFDLDMTLHFAGKGFDYSDRINRFKNLRGRADANKYLYDARWRELDELIYPNEKEAYDLTFQKGNWDYCWFVFDEDDDCNRWERVELYYPYDLFKTGAGKGGVDAHKQSDATGDRGEFDTDNSGKGRLYLSPLDGRIHLYGAEWGAWRIDQNARYFQGFGGLYPPAEPEKRLYKDPESYATVKYTDTDGNGFFDRVEYDLDGDTVFEEKISLIDLGIDDSAPLHDPAKMKYNDFTKLFADATEGIHARAQDMLKVADQHGLNTSWYAFWKQPHTQFEKYAYSYWLALYVYKDLKQLAALKNDRGLIRELDRAYYSGDCRKLLPQSTDTKREDYSFFTQEDLDNIRSASQTRWGEAIIDSLKQTVAERRTHSLTVPLLEGGYGHDYFCPVHNLVLTFDWDKPGAHYCKSCGKYWEGNKRFDWAWVNQVHSRNLSYLTACMYLYIATGEKQYAAYIRDMMLDYASKYATYLDHDTSRKAGPWGGKMLGQSLDESVWASDACRAYQVAKPVMSPEQIREIEEGYLKPCAALLLRRRGTANWQVWHNSGLVALGVALQNDSIIHVAIDDPECGYRKQMQQYVLDDGWWGEGSPTYHYYPLRAMLLSADAVRCRGIDLYDGKLKKMLASPASAVYSDLCFPSHNDGWYGESLVAEANLYEIAYRRYREPFFREVLEQCYRYRNRDGAEALLNNTDIKAANDSPAWPSVCFKEMGYAVLRSGTKTAVLKYGRHGGGHGHPDKLSFSMHDGTKEVVSDLGTTAYGVPAYKQWYRKTLAHSTLTVDGEDQRATTGKLISFKPTKDGGEVKAMTADAYPGVEMERQLMLRKDKLTDCLTARSAEEHTYDYVLILVEKPIFETAGSPVVLNDAPAYSYIKNAETRKATASVSCTTGKARLTIHLPENGVYEVISGEAPGIPPGQTAVNRKYPSRVCYPLIIRVKDKNIKIKAEWNY